jgi:hypothetical protein
MSRLSYVTFWNRSDEELDAPDPEPDFRQDVWPLVNQNAEAVSGVYLWRHSASAKIGWGREFLGQGTPIAESLNAIGPLRAMPNKMRADISAYVEGTGLNVFFETPDLRFLGRLADLWMRSGVLRMEPDKLDVPDGDIDKLRSMTARIPGEAAWFCFSDEGSLMYVFGGQGVLSLVQGMGGARRSTSRVPVVGKALIKPAS